MPEITIPEQLRTIGFVESTPDVFTFTSPTDYEIVVKFNPAEPKQSRINYGPDVVVHNRATSNFRFQETMVVVQCVCDLLARGYSPALIELEKTWPLGHREKGRLDILLRSPDRASYALIECKTWGRAYQSERNEMLKDGGQLFSYFVQERSAKAIYIYSSRIGSANIDVLTEMVRCDDLTGTNAEELYASWTGAFEPSGIFHADSAKYDDSYRGIRAADLRELDHESGVGVFNSFAEILRRNVISDKSNAFNKIFNLFLCKIADEDQHGGVQEMEFQWRIGDTADTLLERLNKLYASGLRDYLNVVVDATRHWPLGEFAFQDIYDETTYKENARVLREVVELLQPYRVKYSSRHQHLGDFFEMLLNTGVKQEAGQFFTPVPLVDGILRSVPLADITNAKIADHSLEILPHVMDFACGAGHFLTQAIERIQEDVVEKVDLSQLGGTQRSRFVSGSSDLSWAREFVYGVESDYRLAKVTKVATFLNGDGLANIMRGDGLGEFHSEPGYVGKLHTATQTRTNPVFDLIASNPPFAVPSFMKSVKNAQTNFRLERYLSNESGEIECLFLERMGQLLRGGGYASVLFPLSILNSGRPVYQGARRILSIEFQIVGLMELRDHTFIATSTTTVCVFARRRHAAEVDAAVAALLVLEDEPDLQELLDAGGLPVDDVIERLNSFTTAEALLEAAYGDDLLAHAIRITADRDKLVVLAYSGDSVKSQEQFLGYRFSRSRGNEGLHLIEHDGVIQSRLFNPLDEDDLDTVSAHVRGNFLGMATAVPDHAASYLRIVGAESIWRPADWTIANPSSSFITTANVTTHSPHGDFIDEVESDLLPFGSWLDDDKVSLVRGATYAKSDEVPSATDVRVLTASNLDLTSHTITLDDFRYLRTGHVLAPEQKPRSGDIVVCSASGSLKHLGKIAVAQDDLDAYIGGFLLILRTDDLATRKVLEYNLLSRRFRAFVTGLKEQNISNLTGAKLRGFPLAVPRDLPAFLALCDEKEGASQLAIAGA